MGISQVQVSRLEKKILLRMRESLCAERLIYIRCLCFFIKKIALGMEYSV